MESERASVDRSHTLTPKCLLREAKLATNVQIVIVTIHHALSWRRWHTIHALAPRRTSADAHLATLFHRRVARAAINRRSRFGTIEFTLDEAMVSVRSFRHDCSFVDDAGPDGGEREEDARDGQNLGAEFGDVVLELEG